MKSIKIIIMFTFLATLSGCYTQLAVRGYDREVYYEEPQEADSSDYYADGEFTDEENYDENDSDLVVNNYYDDPYWSLGYRRYLWGGYYPGTTLDFVFDDWYGFGYFGWHYYDPYFSPYGYYYGSYWDPFPVYYDSWYYDGFYGGGGYYGGGYYGGGYYDGSYFGQYKYRSNSMTRLRNTRGRGSSGRLGARNDRERGSILRKGADRNPRTGERENNADIDRGGLRVGSNSGGLGLTRPTKNNTSKREIKRDTRNRGRKNIKVNSPKTGRNNETIAVQKSKKKNNKSSRIAQEVKNKYKYKVNRSNSGRVSKGKNSRYNKSYKRIQPEGKKSGRRSYGKSRKGSSERRSYKPRRSGSRNHSVSPRRSSSHKSSGSRSRSYSSPRSRGSSHSAARSSSGSSHGSRSSGGSRSSRGSSGGRRR